MKPEPIEREMIKWECPYCGRLSYSRFDCELHMKACGYNPDNENTKAYTGKGGGEARYEDEL